MAERPMCEFKVGDEVLVLWVVASGSSDEGYCHVSCGHFLHKVRAIPAWRLTDLEAEVARLKGVCAERYDEIHRLKAELAEVKPLTEPPRIPLADLEELAAEVERTVKAAHAAAKVPVDRRSASAYLAAVEKADASVRALDIALGAKGDERNIDRLGVSPSGRFEYDGNVWTAGACSDTSFAGVLRGVTKRRANLRFRLDRLAFIDRVNLDREVPHG